MSQAMVPVPSNNFDVGNSAQGINITWFQCQAIILTLEILHKGLILLEGCSLHSQHGNVIKLWRVINVSEQIGLDSLKQIRC